MLKHYFRVLENTALPATGCLMVHTCATLGSSDSGEWMLQLNLVDLSRVLQNFHEAG